MRRHANPFSDANPYGPQTPELGVPDDAWPGTPDDMLDGPNYTEPRTQPNGAPAPGSSAGQPQGASPHMAATKVPVRCFACGHRGQVRLSTLAKASTVNPLLCRCGSRDIDLDEKIAAGFNVSDEAKRKTYERQQSELSERQKDLLDRLIESYLSEPDRAYAEDIWGSMLRERGIDPAKLAARRQANEQHGYGVNVAEQQLTGGGDPEDPGQPMAPGAPGAPDEMASDFTGGGNPYMAERRSAALSDERRAEVDRIWMGRTQNWEADFDRKLADVLVNAFYNDDDYDEVEQYLRSTYASRHRTMNPQAAGQQSFFGHRTAGITDWYDVTVHWRGDEVGVVEAGYARMADAVAKAEEFRADPKVFQVVVFNRGTSDLVWSNGNYVGDFLDEDYRSLVASLNVTATLRRLAADLDWILPDDQASVGWPSANEDGYADGYGDALAGRRKIRFIEDHPTAYRGGYNAGYAAGRAELAAREGSRRTAAPRDDLDTYLAALENVGKRGGGYGPAIQGWVDALRAADADGIDVFNLVTSLWNAVVYDKGGLASHETSPERRQAEVVVNKLVKLRQDRPDLARYLKTGSRHVANEHPVFVKLQAPPGTITEMLNWFVNQAQSRPLAEGLYYYYGVAMGISRAMNRGSGLLHESIRSMSPDQVNALVERVARAAFDGTTGGQAEGHIEQYVYKLADEIIQNAHMEGRVGGDSTGQTQMYLSSRQPKLTRRQKKEARRLRQAMVRSGVDFETATRAAMEAVRR